MRVLCHDEVYSIASLAGGGILAIRLVSKEWNAAANDVLRDQSQEPLQRLLKGLSIRVPHADLLALSKTRRWMLTMFIDGLTVDLDGQYTKRFGGLNITTYRTLPTYVCAHCGGPTAEVLGCKCHLRAPPPPVAAFPWTRAASGPLLAAAAAVLLLRVAARG